MSNYPDHVYSGDLITAELMTSILQRLGQLEEKIGDLRTDETVLVHNMTRRPLSEALVILRKQGLRLGDVMDISGMLLDASNENSKTRIVISHSPSPGSRVAPGTEVDIYLAVLEKGEKLPPKIDSIEPTPADPGSIVTITGANFLYPVSVKIVPLDDHDAEMQEYARPLQPYSGSKLPNVIKLRIPSVSTKEINAKKVTTHISVIAAGGESNAGVLVIQGKAGGIKPPDIREIYAVEKGKLPKLGEQIVIEIPDLPPDPGDIRIWFDDIEVAPDEIYGDRVKVTVPTEKSFTDRVNSRNGSDISVSVQANGVFSEAQNVFIGEATSKNIAKMTAGKATTYIR
jgi:hypothetical protein